MEYLNLLGGPRTSRYGRISAPGSTIDQIASTWAQGSISLAKRKTEVVGEWIQPQLVSNSTPTTSTCLFGATSPFNLNSPFAPFSPSLVVFTCILFILFCSHRIYTRSKLSLGFHNMHPNFIVRRLSPILTIPSRACGFPQSRLGAWAW